MKPRWIAFVGCALALVTACGQYPGVRERALAAGGQAGLGGAGDATVGTPGGPGSTEGFEGSGAGPGGAPASGTAQTGDDGGGTAQGGGDTTGVTDDVIRIGVHAPLTGAAPLKSESFDAGKDLYWKYGAEGKPVTVFGRRVEVVFNDDRYNPSHATLVCKQMVERDRVFMLLGGGGTDQIQACAQYAASKGVPYVSSGVTELRLAQLDNYFALSATYPDQGPILASYIRRHFTKDPKRVAAVVTDTPNFDDAVESFRSALPGARVFRPDKNERGSSMAGSLCTGTVDNFDAVFPLVAPTYYLEMAKAAKCQPQYVGVGVSMGLDAVASTGCEGDGATQGARFFSPTPAFEDARNGKWDPTFMQAAQREGVNPDDIVWLLWTSSMSIHRLLENAGKDLTREGFIARTERSSFETGITPPARFRPDDHFGVDQVHVLRNVCRRRGNQAGYYVTEATFRSRF